MLTPFLAPALALSALALQDAPAPTPADPPASSATLNIEQLPIEQAAATRCAIAFATVSRWQKTGDRRGSAYPDAEAGGGREFFVRVMAKLMDDAELSREGVVDLASREVAVYESPEGTERLAAMMPACQMMKSAAGL